MMRNFLTHANPEWRGQRSTSARIQDPANQDKMKRRRARVVHANWDSLMVEHHSEVVGDIEGLGKPGKDR